MKESITYVYDLPGTYIVSGKPTIKIRGKVIHGVKRVTTYRTLRKWPVYLLLTKNTNAASAVGVCGKFVYVPHDLQIRYSFGGCSKALAVFKVKYGWTKMWWKLWAYLHLEKFNSPV